MRTNVYLTLFLTALLTFGASAQDSKSLQGFDKQCETSATDVSYAPQAAAYDWQEITLPYAETLEFSEANTVQVGSNRGYAFKFTLTNSALVSFSANDWPDFVLYRDADGTDKVFSQMQKRLEFLQAGTYYLTISTWNTSLTDNVSISPLYLESINYPHDGAFSMTASTPELQGSAALAYEFETSSAQVVDFSATADKNVAIGLFDAGNLMDVTGSSYLLGVGKHLIVVMAQESADSGITGNLKINPNTSYAIHEITSLPYQTDFSISQSNSVNIAQRYTQIYSFTVPEARPIRVKYSLNESKYAAFFVYNESGKLMNQSSGNNGTLLGNVNYPAGKYFLEIIDNNNTIADGSTLIGNFKLEILKTHIDVDYSEMLTPEHKIIGSNRAMPDVVFGAGTNPMPTRGYSFNAEAGKLYELKWKVWSSKSGSFWRTGISTMKNVLTGEYNKANDVIIEYSGDYNNIDAGEGILMFKAAETAVVKSAFFIVTMPTADAEVMFELSIKEVAITYTEPSTGDTGLTWDEITLPFKAYLHFDPVYPSVGTHRSNEVARGFKLTLTEKTELSYDYGIDHATMVNFTLYVYKDQALTEPVLNTWNGGTQIRDTKMVLDAGTYYIVFSDSGSSQWSNGVYMSGTCALSGRTTGFTEETVITVTELLNGNIPVVSYNDLTYSKADYWINGISATVKGESDLFLWNGTNYYAAAYKLTGVQAEDTVHITQYAKGNNSVSIYKKEGNTYSRLGMQEWGDNVQGDYSNKTTLDFISADTKDYYIVVASSDKKYMANKVAYNTIIWKPGIEPQPQQPQAPDAVKIASTTASASQIDVPSTATDEEILAMLVELGITGKNVLNEELTLKNNPYGWVISQDGRSASFVNFSTPYEAADNYTAAVVEFTYPVGLSKVNAITVKLAPNPAKDFITVLGLQGGETIRIFDISARLLFVQTAKENNQQISIANLKAGIYTVQISGSGQTQAVKLMVKP